MDSRSLPKPGGCEVCQEYAVRRAAVLDPHMRLRAAIRGVALEVVAREYLFKVHLRHLSGKSLDTTPAPSGSVA